MLLCLTQNDIIMPKLTALEQDALARGVAPEPMRLKAGRVFWDELEAKLPHVTGDSEKDTDRLYAFKKMAEARPYHERRALKEWLEAQINAGYPDVLDGDSELSSTIVMYKEYMEVL